MHRILTLLSFFPLIGLSACGQQSSMESEPERQQTLKYSQETLDKIEQDVNKAMEKSKERIDSTLDQTRY